MDDNIYLLFHRLMNLDQMILDLEKEASKVGLKRNTIIGQSIEDVEQLCIYLDRVVLKSILTSTSNGSNVLSQLP